MVSQWEMIERCHRKYGTPFYDRIGRLYDSAETKIPLLVRERFAVHIESIDWGSVSCEAEASKIFSGVVSMVTQGENNSTVLVEKSRWKDARELLQANFGLDPMLFVSKMNQCLERERLLIQSCSTQNDELSRSYNKQDQAPQAKEPEDIKKLLCKTDLKLTEFQAHIEQLNDGVVEFLGADFEELQKRFTNLHGMLQSGLGNNVEVQNQYQLLGKRISLLKSNLLEKMELTVESTKNSVLCTKEICGKLQQAALAYTEDRRMMITGLRSPRDEMVKLLNTQCTQANHLLLRTVGLIDRLLELYNSLPNRDALKAKVLPHREELFEAFRIYMQHVTVCTLTKQILKVTTERSPAFRADVRIFGGCKLGFDTSENNQVFAQVYKSEDVNNKIMQNIDAKTFCKLENNEKYIELDLPNKDCVAVFDKLMLRNVREKSQALKANREELVWEQKYQIVFTLDVKIKEWVTKLKCVSPMFAIISNPSQEIAARGSLIWQTAFPGQAEVPWKDVANLLSSMFSTFSGRGLEPFHLKYLSERAFRQKKNKLGSTDFSAEPVAYDTLVKKSMSKSKKNFTFWKWISCCLNTVARDKGPAYKDWVRPGVIMGFISRDDVADKLKDANEGSAIIRFSESRIDHDSGGANPFAALNVGFRYVNRDKGIDDVYFTMETLDPSVSDSYKLKTRGLGLILRGFIPRGEGRLIQYIYPNIPLGTAFQDEGMASQERDYSSSNSGPYVEALTALSLNMGEGHFALKAKSQQAAFESQGSPFSNITSPGSVMDDSQGTLSPGPVYNDQPFPIDLQDLNLGSASSSTANSATAVPPQTADQGEVMELTAPELACLLDLTNMTP